MTDPELETEEPTEGPSAYPRWYDPDVPLVVCMDGPRAGGWYTQSWLDRGWLPGYTPTCANPVPHRLDARVVAAPLGYAPVLDA